MEEVFSSGLLVEEEDIPLKPQRQVFTELDAVCGNTAIEVFNHAIGLQMAEESSAARDLDQLADGMQECGQLSPLSFVPPCSAVHCWMLPLQEM